MGDIRITAADRIPLSRQERIARRRKIIIIVASSFLVLLILGFIIPVNNYVPASGYVTTEEYAEIRSPVVGKVKRIFVSSGDIVKKGEMLVQLEADEEMASLGEAKKQFDKVEAELKRRSAEIEEEKRRLTEDINVAILRLQNATSRLARTRELFSKGLVAGSIMEEDELKEKLVRAELESLQKKDISLYEKELMVLREELDAKQEAVIKADANVKAKEIRAPISGQVLKYEFVSGELVKPETVLMEIFGGSRQILKLRVPERYATKVNIGNKYAARLGSYKTFISTYFYGKVEALRNVIQSEAGTTYRVVYCSFDAKNKHVPPGTTAEAKIYIGKRPLWFFLFGIN
jgi:multidrug resistance efflux pump